MLIIMEGKEQGKGFLVGNGGVLGVECGGNSQIVISDNHMSRRHFEISVEGKKVILRDLESRNGTFLNNKKISENNLKKFLSRTGIRNNFQ